LPHVPGLAPNVAEDIKRVVPVPAKKRRRKMSFNLKVLPDFGCLRFISHLLGIHLNNHFNCWRYHGGGHDVIGLSFLEACQSAGGHITNIDGMAINSRDGPVMNFVTHQISHDGSICIRGWGISVQNYRPARSSVYSRFENDKDFRIRGLSYFGLNYSMHFFCHVLKTEKKRLMKLSNGNVNIF
jgi:hypothetical protein